MNNFLAPLMTGAEKLGLTVTEEQQTLFWRFFQLMLERNAQINLTAITEPREVAIKHFVDSLTVELVHHFSDGQRIIDIGTGAGFPGIPLAIRYPEVEMVLNDSVGKKVDFLADVARALPLPNVTPIWARAEALGRDKTHRGQYHAVMIRAVAHLAILAEYALPLLRLHGVCIAMKGPNGERELMESEQALDLIGGKVREVRKVTLEEAGERVLIVIEKSCGTPECYPRETGMARKKPLFLDSSKGDA